MFHPGLAIVLFSVLYRGGNRGGGLRHICLLPKTVILTLQPPGTKVWYYLTRTGRFHNFHIPNPDGKSSSAFTHFMETELRWHIPVCRAHHTVWKDNDAADHSRKWMHYGLVLNIVYLVASKPMSWCTLTALFCVYSMYQVLHIRLLVDLCELIPTM